MSRSPVKIPERIQLDAYRLSEAKKNFFDTHGHEPDMIELADTTGIPVKRLAKINQYALNMPSEENYGGDLEASVPDFAQDALEAVHHDSDHTDRRIIEMKLGYGGNTPLSPQDVGQQLNLTPSQLSRRSLRLAKRVHDYQAALEKI
jgi:DNA-directed RNA polymerase specialized sigma subunit